MMRIKVQSLFVSLLFLIACSGFLSAAIFDDGGASLQGILDGSTVGGSSSVNVMDDLLSDGEDSLWEIGATGGSISSLMFTAPGTAGVGFGVYAETPSGREYIELFSSSAAVGQQAMLSIDASGNVYRNIFENLGVNIGGNNFGYYVEHAGNFWHSESGLNAGGVDYMAAYQGNDSDQVQIGQWAPGVWGANEYVLAWEYGIGADMQYDDFVVMVESVTPVPEPATMLLLGLGGLILRKRRK